MAAEEEEGLQTFSLDVAGEGADALRNTIMNKLSDFMGTHMDDVLAEYVVVLVSHGKHRAQAVKDLEAFLGDRSEAFVSWLWEHLGSSIHLYTSAPKEPSPTHDTTDTELQEQGVMQEPVNCSPVNNAESKEKTRASGEGGRLITLRRDAGKATEIKSKRDMVIATLRAAQAESSGLTRTGSIRPAKRPRSPDLGPPSEKAVAEKQKRQLSPPKVSAARRLLQSAVRDAVAPAPGRSKRLLREAVAPVMREAGASAHAAAEPTVSYSRRSESSLRLHSVVSAENEASELASVQRPSKEVRRPHVSRQGKRAMPAIMMAMKAAAAAAEDVTKVRGRLSGNIWDRLGKKAIDVVDMKDEAPIERYEEGNHEPAEARYEDEQENKRRRLDKDDLLSEHSIEEDVVVSGSVLDEHMAQSVSSKNVSSFPSNKYREDGWNGDDYASNDDAGDGADIRGSSRRRRRREESVTVEYRASKKESHKQKGLGASSGVANSSQKIVNISVNVNTWKPEAYEKVKESGPSEPTIVQSVSPMQEQPAVLTTAAAGMVGVMGVGGFPEESVDNTHMRSVRETQPDASKQSERVKEAPKVVPPSVLAGAKQGRKLDDVESRTVFVTNIHFAASKESVMTHFASCGEIGRVVMLTDGATGQPKGSAYIEFKSKDGTERALALNESSFYSRALKVVRKDAAIQAIQEMNPLIHPALIRRPIPLALRLPLRARLLRGAPYILQPRFAAVPRPPPFGKASMQWKRDGSVPTSILSRPPGFNVPVRPAGRSLSYVRSSTSTGVKVAGAELPSGAAAATGGAYSEKEEAKPVDVGGAEKSDVEMADVQMEQV